MGDDGGTIIHLFGAPPAIEGTPEVVERKGFCYPHAPRVDKVSRTVTCAKCKQALDPVDVLLEVARNHDHWSALLNQTRTMRAELEALKAEEKRVKARTKSHRNKDAQEAIRAERQRSERKRAEMSVRVDDIRRALKRLDQLIGLEVREARAMVLGLVEPFEVMSQQICPVCHQTGHDAREHDEP